MGQACTYGSVKLILVTFTSIMMALGAALLAISIFLYFDKDSIFLHEGELSGFDSETVVYIGMAAGGIMIVVALIGLIGALTKSFGALYFFLFILLLTFGLEIGGGVVGFVWRDQVQDDLPGEMKTAFEKYDDDADIAEAWDKIHEEYECCGRMGPTDFELTRGQRPPSCKNEQGCYFEVEKNIKRTLEMGAASLIAFSLFQMLVMCFAGLMLLKLHRGEGKHIKGRN